MFLKSVCICLALNAIICIAQYRINTDWILKETYPKVPSLRRQEKDVCEEICMRYDCLKSNTDVATYCRRVRCPTKESCSCEFDKVADYSTLRPKFKDCLKLTSWWKQFEIRKSAFRTKCGISIDSFSWMNKVSAHKITDLRVGFQGKQKFKISWGNEAEQLRFPWSFRINEPTQQIDTKTGKFTTVDKGVGSAVLIGPTTLLTAKHNVKDNVKRITYTYSGGDVEWKKGGKAKANNIIQHPTVDLAIIELDRQVDNTAPICLPSKNDVFPPPDIQESGPESYPYRTAGWGRTFRGSYPDKLTWIDIRWDAGPITSKRGRTCGAGLDYICSRNGYFGTYNVCKGDSGTGWIYRKLDSENMVRWHLMGTLSQSQRDNQTGVKCDKRNVADSAMWVNVKKQIHWICDNSRVEC